MTQRLLVVSNYYPPNIVGGAEVVAHRQAKMLQGLGWDVRVFAGEMDSRPPEPKLPSYSVDSYDGLEVTRLYYNETNAGMGFYDEQKGLIFRRRLEEFGPDVVHFHNVMGLGANLISIARESSATVVVTLHDYWGFCFKNIILRNDLKACRDFEECHLCSPQVMTRRGSLPIRLRRDLVAWSLDQADAFISPSVALAANYQKAGIGHGRLHVVSSGIDVNVIMPRARHHATPLQFLCSCYIGEHKGVHQLVEALKLLWARTELRGRWRVSIAGKGHLDAWMRDAIEAGGLASAVVMVGHLPRPQLLSMLDEAHVVVLPSIWPENEPVCLLEGIASGAALIAGAVGGNPDLVEHGVNGLLYDSRDPSALAEAMEEIIVSPELVRAFSRENIFRRQRYDEAETGRRIEEIYAAGQSSAKPKDFMVLCGTKAPSEKFIKGFSRLPATFEGKRVRFLWWEWARGPAKWTFDVAWIWDLEWQPSRYNELRRKARRTWLWKGVDMARLALSRRWLSILFTRR